MNSGVKPMVTPKSTCLPPDDRLVSAESRSVVPMVPRVSPGWRAGVVLGGLALTVLATLMVCLQFGAQPIPFSHTFRVLLGPLGESLGRAFGRVGTTELANGPEVAIILHLRLPRLVLAFCVGGTLAVVGACLQALLRNPLADPYVLGISSGATLGATVAMTSTWIVLVLGTAGLPLCALAGGLLVMVVLYRLASTKGGLPLPTVLLLGVIFNAVLSALSMFVTSLLSPEQLSRILAWLMGSLGVVDGWRLALTGGGLAVGVVLLMAHARDLNALLVGEGPAHALGVSVESVKRRVFFLCAGMTGLVVSVSGMIGFVGMVVPHAVRVLLGADHRLLLPASVLSGGAFLMCADTLARTMLAPTELPVGVMTALAGGPVFVHLLLAHRQGATIGDRP